MARIVLCSGAAIILFLCAASVYKDAFFRHERDSISSGGVTAKRVYTYYVIISKSVSVIFAKLNSNFNFNYNLSLV